MNGYLDKKTKAMKTQGTDSQNTKEVQRRRHHGEILEPDSAPRSLRRPQGRHRQVKAFDDRAYGHCLVAGIKKYPSKVIRKDSAKKTAKKSTVKLVDLKKVVTPDVLTSKDKKVTALKETKKRFGERFKMGKNRWFFTKLRF
uniref:60S ribosomal protein L27-like n=1 Tax=Fragaria vesca subsp. vesca TaxID=101020 RepID=UPI0005C91E58|nr:PREDICTED: 60S ribosomal protein L27-like [Fragaria vesca subsp. vesca]